jgi:hypothetical protein
MSIESTNKDIVRRLYEMLNAGQVERAAGLVSADYLEHDPLPGQGTGREGAVDRFSALTRALAPPSPSTTLSPRATVSSSVGPIRELTSATSPASRLPERPLRFTVSTSTGSLQGSSVSIGM